MRILKRLIARLRSAGQSISDANQSTASHATPLPDVAIPRRQLSKQEMSWVHDLVSANPEWNGIQVEQLHAIAQCPCGECRSVKLERPPAPQNPAWAQWAHGETSFLRFGFPVGSIYIQAKNYGLVQVMLFTDGGFLDWLEVVSLEGKPLPDTIEELSREVSSR